MARRLSQRFGLLRQSHDGVTVNVDAGVKVLPAPGVVLLHTPGDGQQLPGEWPIIAGTVIQGGHEPVADGRRGDLAGNFLDPLCRRDVPAFVGAFHEVRKGYPVIPERGLVRRCRLAGERLRVSA